MLISPSKIHCGNQRNTLSKTLIGKGDFKEIAQLHSQGILTSTKHSMAEKEAQSISCTARIAFLINKVAADITQLFSSVAVIQRILSLIFKIGSRSIAFFFFKSIKMCAH